jgi:uncharacterized membrane protein (DUF2068 family)
MRRRPDDIIVLIGVFKLLKALVLCALGVTALVKGSSVVAGSAKHLIGWLGLFPGHRSLLALADKLWSLNSHAAARLTVMVLAYGVIFLVEGVALLSGRTWAEWLTVVVTGSFIPVELYEVFVHVGPGKVSVLIVNVVIVAYLVWRRLGGRVARRDPRWA